jgi:hypothetical protein
VYQIKSKQKIYDPEKPGETIEPLQAVHNNFLGYVMNNQQRQFGLLTGRKSACISLEHCFPVNKTGSMHLS